MEHKIRPGMIAGLLLLPAVAIAQSPPKSDPPVAPKAEQLDSNNCADADTQSTVGKGRDSEPRQTDGKNNLSDKLARSGGVICPPQHVDPEIRQPTPPAGSMPVIPPPGSPGGDQSVQPK